MSAGQFVEEPARILAVCTANISRSPAVERLLRAGLDDSVLVGSAGVAALVGSPIDVPVAEFLRQRGADPTRFAARPVDEHLVADTDLVLTLTRAHRSVVLELVPSAVRRTFSLLEFTRILASLDLSGLPAAASSGARLRALVPLATSGRALAPRARAEADDDVPDPYGRGAAEYAHSLSLITDATDLIVRLVRGPQVA
jgi:low molecular weight protein-tyrosine phosphatase